MTHRYVAARAVTAPPPGRLEPDAIGVAQDTVIGMASAAPAVCVALTLAPLATVAAYGGVTSIVITGVPMLIIANAYRRLNMWNANCGASFEWVGRAINPYLGFLTGWLMVAGYIIGAVAGVEVLGPSVLAVFTSSPGSAWTYVLIATAIALVMLIIAIIGIRVTARTQVGMAAVEYTILIGFAIVGLFFVLNHHAGTTPIKSSWFAVSGIGGHGSLAAGLLLSVFIFSGWEGTLYVNEETKHRRTNPGRAAIIAVVLLTIIYAVAQLGLQGVVSPHKLQTHADSALVYVARAIGGSGWSQVMALSLALSVIAATLTNIVLTSRIIYGMASYRALPGFLSTVSRRFATPISASVVVGLLLIALTWIYLLANSVTEAFTAVIDVSGLLFGSFYILTAFATVVYYRRRVYTNAWDALILGVLPVGAAGFLGWIIYQSVKDAPASQIWSLVGVVVIGVILMFGSRFVLRSPFFQIARESDTASSDLSFRSR
jgi:amino acid transporter